MSRIFLSLFFLSLCVGLLTGCRPHAQVPPRPAPEVVLAEVQVRDVPVYLETTGHAQAYEYVDVPARVSGFLRELRYTPGDIVPAGTPLFLIEPDQYQLAVEAAEASLESANAQLLLAEADLSRTKKLFTEGALTKEDLDTGQAKRDSAAADVLKATSDLGQAKLNLSYTDVRSPIEGKVSKNQIDIGNMVGPSVQNGSTSILTSVAGLNPIFIYFDISDVQFDRVRATASSTAKPTEETEKLRRQLTEIKEVRKKAEVAANPVPTTTQAAKPVVGETKADPLRIPFQIGLIKGTTPNKTVYSHTGIIDMADNKIDLATGTIQIRGEIPNENHDIYPGRICRVRVPLTTVAGALLIREEAVMTDMNRKYVFVVDEQSVAYRRDVELGDVQADNMQVVLKGLKGGEKYIVTGTLKARNGKPVKAIAQKNQQSEPRP